MDWVILSVNFTLGVLTGWVIGGRYRIKNMLRPRSGPQATPPGLECICNPPLGPVRQPGRLHQWYCPALKEG